MPGLTAKVFRTYNASWTMARLLKEMKSTGNIAEKVKDYNNANRQVAILCNHKRTVTASHASSIEKMQEKVSHTNLFISRHLLTLAEDQWTAVSSLASEAADDRY